MNEALRTDEGIVREAFAIAARAKAEMAKRIVGKEAVIRGILTGVLASGHVLLEGVPGLAKTLAVKTFAEISGLEFSRIQFTPDLLPADITGSLVYEQATGKFQARRGPLFANVVLADEVNRAPAKVQSALLEAMEEGQVTIGDASHKLPEPFFVLATQNPIEHEGTYALPEAQLDRFLMKVYLGYPSAEEETAIVAKQVERVRAPLSTVLGPMEIKLMRLAAEAVTLDEAIAAYIVRIVRATRPKASAPAVTGGNGANSSALAGLQPRTAALSSFASTLSTAAGLSAGGRFGVASAAKASISDSNSHDIERWVEFGASPRASIHLYRCARIFALLDGRDYALPDDVKAAAPEVLRHRLVLSYQAEADGIDADAIVANVLRAVVVP